MTETKPTHTPGPFRVVLDACDPLVFNVLGGSQWPGFYQDEGAAEREAARLNEAWCMGKQLVNADLLKAAKAMLFEHPYACRTNQPTCKAGTCADKRLRAAIAKAQEAAK